MRISRVGWTVLVVFTLALVLGSGPGIWLVDGTARVPLPGGLVLPALYAWGLLWYFVEALCIVIAYIFVWRAPDDEIPAAPPVSGNDV